MFLPSIVRGPVLNWALRAFASILALLSSFLVPAGAGAGTGASAPASCGAWVWFWVWVRGGVSVADIVGSRLVREPGCKVVVKFADHGQCAIFHETLSAIPPASFCEIPGDLP